jgi:alkyl hydroperoxide reductase subunit AhpC
VDIRVGDFRDALADLHDIDAIITDPPYPHEFIPLLADLEKQVAKDYGILGPLGFYRRSIFVIDSNGIIRWARRAAAGLTFRPVDEIVEAVRSIGE